LLAVDLLVGVLAADFLARRVVRDERSGGRAVRTGGPPGVDRAAASRRQVEPERRRRGDRRRVRVVVAGAVVARGGRRRGPRAGQRELGLRRCVVRVVAAADDGARAAAAATTAAAPAGRADAVDVVVPRPVRARIGAVPRLELAVRDDVVTIARDRVVAGDVAGELRARLDHAVLERRLRRVPRVLDSDREAVRRDAVLVALLAASARALVRGRDVPRAVRLADELGDLRAVLLHDVVRARARGGVAEPAPAPRVAALAGVDHDEARL